MKANTLASHRKLIADITVQPRAVRAYRNRRGNLMEVTNVHTPRVTPVALHATHIHSDGTPQRSNLFITAWGTITATIVRYAWHIWLQLPSWSPKKYTLRDGLTTSWRAALPRRTMLTSSGSLAVMLMIAGITVWNMPQGATSTAKPRQPISTTIVPAQTSDNGVLSSVISRDTAENNDAPWMVSPAGTSNNNQSSAATITPLGSSQPVDGASNDAAVTPDILNPVVPVIVPPIEEPETPVEPDVPEPIDLPVEPIAPTPVSEVQN